MRRTSPPRASVCVARPKTARPKTRSPGCTMRDAGADGLHDTADLVAEDAGVGRFARVERERLEHVAEIHAGGFDVDKHLARPAGRQRKGGKAREYRDGRVRGIRGGAGQRDRATARSTGRPRSRRCDITRLAAEGDFAFGIRAEQFGPEQERSSAAEASGGRSMPRQVKFGYSFRMTRSRPTAGACATAAGMVSRPTD